MSDASRPCLSRAQPLTQRGISCVILRNYPARRHFQDLREQDVLARFDRLVARMAEQNVAVGEAPLGWGPTSNSPIIRSDFLLAALSIKPEVVLACFDRQVA